MIFAPETLRLLRLAGLATALMVGVAAGIEGMGRPMGFARWFVALTLFTVLYGAAFSWLYRPRPQLLAVLAAQSACVIVMVASQYRGLEGLLLVLVAMELGLILPRRNGLVWIAVQSLALFFGIAYRWSLREALLFALPYFGFQILAFLIVELLGREVQARTELAQANAELIATREMLAERARLGERLRIAGELHDAMGHHLAGLSLNLEVLAQSQPASPPLATARSLTRRLLDDVESAVDTLQDRGIDLQRVLAAITTDIPRPRVHVHAQGLAVSDPARAHVLLRCCQEIVTNAVKHADAENLWITISYRNDTIEVVARDDGRGASQLTPGQGLQGMRRRLEELGGALDLETHAGGGFQLKASLPLTAA